MNNQDSHCRCGTDGEQVNSHTSFVRALAVAFAP